MARDAGRLLRRAGGTQRVTFMELFFDLVYVLAVTQLSHLLLEHLSARGAGQTLLLLVAVWVAWVYNAWLTSFFDSDLRGFRLVLLGVMLASLIMSATLPQAFGERGLVFAGAYLTIQAGRAVFAAAVLRAQPRLRRDVQRILSWLLASGLLWLAGGLAHGTEREVLWLVAVMVDLAAPACGFYTPGLGRSKTTDWAITGAHLSERCEGFLILALGESLLVAGTAFGELPFSMATKAAFLVAFLTSVALWWIYFDRSATDASAVIAASAEPGRLGRSAYTYCHLPMVAGIIVTAVGVELTITNPLGHTSVATVATVLGGPALFLAGHAMFKRVLFGRLSVPRLLAIAVLVALVPVGLVAPPLVVATAAMLVIATVAWRDTRTSHQAQLPVPAPA